MQSVAGLVVIPHRTTDTRCSAGKVAVTGLSVEEKKPTSPSKPSTEGKLKNGTTGMGSQLKNCETYCNYRSCQFRKQKHYTFAFIQSSDLH